MVAIVVVMIVAISIFSAAKITAVVTCGVCRPFSEEIQGVACIFVSIGLLGPGSPKTRTAEGLKVASPSNHGTIAIC